nr:reverse transcriptase domain-containing protein [Tanacetum cinerariifolium]
MPTGGNLFRKTTREALKIIENKSKVHYTRSKSNVSRVNTNSRESSSKTDDRIDKLADQILNFVEIVNKQVITPATAKAVEKTYVIYGGAHAYYDCIATDSNQPSVCAEWEENLKRNMNNDMRSILGSFFQNQASTSGTLLSNIVPNPKGDMKVVTTRSGLAYEGPSIPTNSPLKKRIDQPHPKGVTEDVFVKAGKFHFLTDFVVVDFEADPRVPLILGRSFLRTGRALIDVYGEEITLRVNDESVPFNLNQTMRYSSTYDDSFVNRVDVIDIACEEFVQDVSDFCKEPIVKSSSPTLTPFGESDFFLEEIEYFLKYESIPTGIEDSFYDPKGNILYLEKLLNDDPSQLPPMDLKQAEETKAKSSIEEPSKLELKELPSHLEYTFLEETDKLSVNIANHLKDDEKETLFFDHHDNPSFPRPPPKPPDVEIFFEPNSGVLTTNVVKGLSKMLTPPHVEFFHLLELGPITVLCFSELFLLAPDMYVLDVSTAKEVWGTEKSQQQSRMISCDLLHQWDHHLSRTLEQLDKNLVGKNQVLMIKCVRIVEIDMVIHTAKTDMMKLVVEIECVGMSANVFDKETGSSDGLQLEQAELNFIHALNEPHLHEIHVVQLLLRVPIKDNIYNVDLKSVAPTGGIKREFIIARTPQQNGVAVRKNITLIEATKTMDHLGKYDGKADEGFFVGYFVVSKAMRVFNKRTRIVEETLNISFLEIAPNVKGNRPDWLFDIDSLSISMNYKQVVAGKQTNGIAGTKYNIVASQAKKKKEPKQEYILIPICITDPFISQGPKYSAVDAGRNATEVDESRVLDNGGQDDLVTRNVFERLLQQERQTEHINSTNSFNTISSSVNTTRPSFANTASPSQINLAGTPASTNAFREHPFE